MRALILQLMTEVAENADCILVDDIHDDTVLLESGLDSLGFAILVARLEEELGRDPFAEMEEVIYPRTLGEFIAIYDR
jgi:acyl carrier protein